MYVQSTQDCDSMNIKEVQNSQGYERRKIRVNIRLTPSQMKFINNNNLSITKIMNEALKQLGYTNPKLDDIPKEDRWINEDTNIYRRKGKGDIKEQRKRWKQRQRDKRNRY